MVHVKMKTVRRLLLFFLVGCAINILVAWFAAFNFPPARFAVFPGREQDPTAAILWKQFRQSDWPEHPEEMTKSQGSNFTLTTGFTENEYIYFVTEARYGYPCRSLSCYIWGNSLLGKYYEKTLPKHDVAHFFLADTRFLFPTHPLWVGFLVNSLLYGFALYLFIVFTVYRRKRDHLERLRCPQCAYPIIEWKKCPECGFNLSSIPIRVRRKVQGGMVATQNAEDGIKAHLAAEKRYKSKKYLPLFAVHAALTGGCILLALGDPNLFSITLGAIVLVAFCVAFPFWLRFPKGTKLEPNSDQNEEKK